VIEHESARLSLADLVIEDLGDPTRTAALRAHAATCDRCQVELAALQHMHAMLEAIGPAPRPDDRLRQRVLTGMTADREPGASHWRTVALGLAVTVLALTAALVLQLVAR
jgi:anti-sigma factor RsiW